MPRVQGVELQIRFSQQVSSQIQDREYQGLSVAMPPPGAGLPLPVLAPGEQVA